MRVVHDSTLIRDERLGVDARRDGPAGVNLGLNLRRDLAKATSIIRIRSVFGNGRIGKDLNRLAVPIVRAGPAGVESRARRVDVGTKAVGRVGRAGQVGLTGLVGNKAVAVNHFVNARVRAAVARTGDAASAVENVLNAEIDRARGVAGDLDAICEGTEGTMSPAAAAVLWDVLIERVCQEGNAVDVAPGEPVRDFGDVFVWERRGVVVADGMAWEDLKLIVALGERGGEAQEEEDGGRLHAVLAVTTTKPAGAAEFNASIQRGSSPLGAPPFKI